jgi:hypothetical protein
MEAERGVIMGGGIVLQRCKISKYKSIYIYKKSDVNTIMVT